MIPGQLEVVVAQVLNQVLVVLGVAAVKHMCSPIQGGDRTKVVEVEYSLHIKNDYFLAVLEIKAQDCATDKASYQKVHLVILLGFSLDQLHQTTMG
jgi:hypothetical protein